MSGTGGGTADRSGKYELTAPGLTAPGVGDGFAWFQDQQVVADHEGVQPAGHGLDSQRPPALVRA